MCDNYTMQQQPTPASELCDSNPRKLRRQNARRVGAPPLPPPKTLDTPPWNHPATPPPTRRPCRRNGSISSAGSTASCGSDISSCTSASDTSAVFVDAPSVLQQDVTKDINTDNVTNQRPLRFPISRKGKNSNKRPKKFSARKARNSLTVYRQQRRRRSSAGSMGSAQVSAIYNAPRCPRCSSKARARGCSGARRASAYMAENGGGNDNRTNHVGARTRMGKAGKKVEAGVRRVCRAVLSRCHLGGSR